MNRQQLDSLIGLDINKAEKNVKDAGLKPESLGHKTIVCAISLDENVVRLVHRDGKVVSAETQDSIDEKYSKR